MTRLISIMLCIITSLCGSIIVLLLTGDWGGINASIILTTVLIAFQTIFITHWYMKEDNIFSPILVFNYAIAIFYSFASVLLISTNYFFHHHSLSPMKGLSKSLFFTIIAVIIVFFGYGFSRTKPMIKIPKLFQSKPFFSFYTILIIYLIIGITSFYFYYVKHIGGLYSYLTTFYARSHYAFGYGYFLWGSRFISIAGVLFCVHHFIKNNRISLWGSISLLVSFTFEIFQGNRSRTLIVALAVFIFYYNFIKKISLKWIACLAVFSIGFIGLFGIVRSGIPQTLQKGDFSSIFYESDFIKSTIYAIRAVDRQSLIFEIVPERVPFQLGKTYFNLLLFPIPRKIFPDKPYGAGPLFAEALMPGQYNPESKASTSLTTTFFGELYLNFSFFGLLFCFPYGYLLGRLACLRKLISIREGIFYAITVSWLGLHFINAEFIGSSIWYLTEIVPIMFCIKFTNFGQHTDLKKFNSNHRIN